VPRKRTPSPQTIKVLHALAAEPARWRYGYELGTQTGLKAGSLYPILVRLADRGLLDAQWEQSPPHGRPARHLYRLTADGLELAAATATAAAAPAARAPRGAAAPGLAQHPQPGGA
jgi:DNA-binding PadR family transcriptional regulator